jgi:hypothetical protein
MLSSCLLEALLYHNFIYTSRNLGAFYIRTRTLWSNDVTEFRFQLTVEQNIGSFPPIYLLFSGCELTRVKNCAHRTSSSLYLLVNNYNAVTNDFLRSLSEEKVLRREKLTLGRRRFSYIFHAS